MRTSLRFRFSLVIAWFATVSPLRDDMVPFPGLFRPEVMPAEEPIYPVLASGSATLTVSAEPYLREDDEKHHITGYREALRGNELGL